MVTDTVREHALAEFFGSDVFDLGSRAAIAIDSDDVENDAVWQLLNVLFKLRDHFRESRRRIAAREMSKPLCEIGSFDKLGLRHLIETIRDGRVTLNYDPYGEDKGDYDRWGQSCWYTHICNSASSRFESLICNLLDLMDNPTWCSKGTAERKRVLDFCRWLNDYTNCMVDASEPDCKY